MVEKALSPLEAILFELVKAGLQGRTPDIPQDLSRHDWEMLIGLARKQSVTGLLYRGVSFCPEGYRLPEPILFLLVAEIGRVERQGKNMQKVAEDLFARLTGEGLSPILMKGPSVAAYYPEPLQREYGDIDLYLTPKEFEKAPEVLGVQADKAPDGSLHYLWKGVDVDQHRKYFDLHLPVEKLPAPGTPEAVLLMLSAHAMKHAVGAGVGLRQCIDMSVAYQHLGASVSAEGLERIYKDSGTLRWNRLLSAFIEEYLDFHPVFGGKGTNPGSLLQIVQEGGNFGHHASGRKEALGKTPFRRKADTAFRFLRRLPFALRYAPRESCFSILDLAKGNTD